MKDFLVIVGVGFAGYWILGQVMQSQQQAAIAACGGANAVTLATASGGCSQLNVVNQRWSWFPQWIISL